MKQYSLYEADSGRVISVCEAPEDQMPPEGPAIGQPGLMIRHSKNRKVVPDEDRIVGGKLVRKTANQIENQRIDAEWIKVRSQRTGLLAASDWTQNLDSPLPANKRLEWARYRKKLRDITDDHDDPFNIDWPEEPK